MADDFGCRLVGGDSNRGALSITISVLGGVPVDSVLLRSGARPGDRVYVTGCLGDAAAGVDR